MIAVTNVEAALLGPYLGKVVDAETGLPIKGAIVVVSWGKSTPTPAGAVSGFIEAAMCETGDTGEYHIQARMAAIGLFSYVDGITFIVYQSGYMGFSKTFYDEKRFDESRLLKLARLNAIPIDNKRYDEFENDMYHIDPYVDNGNANLNPLNRLKILLRGVPEREVLRARTDWEKLFRRYER